MSSIHVSKQPRPQRVTRQEVETIGSITFYLHMEKTRVPVLFGIVGNVFASVLFGALFIDRFVSLFCAKPMEVRYNSQQIPILIVHEVSDGNQTTTIASRVASSSALAVKTEKQEHVMCVAVSRTVEPMSEIPVLAKRNVSVVVQFDCYMLFEEQYPCMAALGVM